MIKRTSAKKTNQEAEGKLMRTETGKIESQTVLAEDLHLQGMWVGNCTVEVGARLELHGLVTGNLIVEEGAESVVHGTVAGDVVGHGYTEINGTVGGTATGEGLRIAHGAAINTRR
ncbi:hypothetical protein GCM10027038_12130 [Arthrobacter bambusae]